jgi:hypothetical protein
MRRTDPDEEALLSGAVVPPLPSGSHGHDEEFLESDDTKVFLRIHKFQFQWDLSLHLTLCLASLVPFVFSGDALLSIIPLFAWVFYNGEPPPLPPFSGVPGAKKGPAMLGLFMLGARRASQLLPG